jgi:hypothetical protein
VPIKAILRNGNEYILSLEGTSGDSAEVFTEVAAGRSQLLRGWVRVKPADGTNEIVVLGEEIVELHLLTD